MYIEALRLELRKGDHERRSNLSVEAPEFLPSSPFSINAKEFVPFTEIVRKLVEELEEKLELKQLKPPLSVKAKEFVPASQFLPLNARAFVLANKKENVEEFKGESKEELEEEFEHLALELGELMEEEDELRQLGEKEELDEQLDNREELHEEEEWKEEPEQLEATR